MKLSDALRSVGQSITDTVYRTAMRPVQTAMGGLSSLGVEVLALGETDTGIDRASEYRFLGIWRFPDLQARDALLAGIKASGWYDYFDHVNAACNAGGFEHHLAALAAG